jgi:hypothetical protein
LIGIDTSPHAVAQFSSPWARSGIELPESVDQRGFQGTLSRQELPPNLGDGKDQAAAV